MIRIQNLNVRYGTKRVIKNLTIGFRKGKVSALIGESGTGKTTLALSILGLCSGNISGKILVDGENINGYDDRMMRAYRWNKASMVFQNLHDVLNPVIPVIKQVIEPMVEHGVCDKREARERAGQLFASVNLDTRHMKALPRELSGGQLQRVSLAMALANDPGILVLDEPTSALDPVGKRNILDFIDSISSDKIILVITHDISVARDISDEMAVFYGGMILERGKTDVILKDPMHPYTRGLLRSYPNMSTTKDLQGIKGMMAWSPAGCPFNNRCTQKTPLCATRDPQLTERNGRLLACHQGGIVRVLEGTGITKRYKRTVALDGVDFVLYEGETMVVVGESGSGKSTLAKCIMGLEKADRGTLFYQGKTCRQRDKDFYSNVQVVYQDPRDSISHRFSVYKAVLEPLLIHGIKSAQEQRRRIAKALEDVQLPTDEEFLSRRPMQLSGGELQRAAIARALVLDPKILIADECTSALDVSVQAKIMRLFLTLQEKRGLTLLFITHDISLARKISDKILVLKGGRVVETGMSSLLIEKPRTAYTRALIDASPHIY